VGRRVLTGLGIETKNILLDPANSDLISELAETQLVFNLVDSNRFEPAAAYWAAALLERLQLPYKGSRLNPWVLTTDKIQTKLTLRHAGLVTPDWIRKGDTASSGN
jgi:D-alanine-D-alanine ligase-like ATP-grasp enzyme